MASEMVRQLIDSGIHFGHQAGRWNPKMKPYIFGKRNLIHIIDIKETIKGLIRAKKFVAQTVARGNDVLFVGTKRQAKKLVATKAHEVGMPFVTERWLGGTLTNFRTIRSRLARLEELERIEAEGELQNYSKKRIASLMRELRKIKRNLDGIRTMNRVPGALVIVDVSHEHIAVQEARKLGIPTVCLIDTDSDPDWADIPVPGNDDAMRSIEIFLAQIGEAVMLGKRAQTSERSDREEAFDMDRRRRREMGMRSSEGPGGAAVVEREVPPQIEKAASTAGLVADLLEAPMNPEDKQA